MWNTVSRMSSTPPLTDTLARRAVERSVRERQDELATEMRRIVEATYELVEESGALDPSMRQILAATGLSTQAFYRHFRSKDELMLALLDDGRRQLVGTLERRMAKARTPANKVRAWIEGVLAQAGDARAAARTRPFVAGEDRLAERYPDEHRASVDLILSPLIPPIAALGPGARRRSDGNGTSTSRRDAEAVYRLTFATLHDHLRARTRPTPAAVDHLCAFVLAGIAGRR